MQKWMIDLALEAAKRHLSEQTGMIHFCYQDYSSRDCIPLFENFCYALALFRTHERDQVLKGSELLSHLLNFQCENGGFPVYLHEYPHCRSPRHTPPLIYIYENYRHVIEKGLRERLKRAVERMPEAIAFTPRSSKEISALVQQGISVKPYWKFGTYIGAPYDEEVCRSRPRQTLLDTLMGREELDPVHLRASLLTDKPTDVEVVSQVGEWKWELEEGDDYASATIQKYTPAEVPKGFHLFRLVLPEDISLALPPGSFSYENGVVTYSEEVPDFRERMELNLFMTKENVTPTIAGSRATAFEIGETLTLDTPTHTVRLKFEPLTEGTFFGHIAYGNRPGQVSRDEFAAYDWRISVRSVERPAHAKLRIKIEWESRSSHPSHESRCQHIEQHQ
ncbi:MAG: hypothetical protein MRY21_08205 [Simkaniaceae bacterium]|nr:hypothetical protein [Simkaniaceae bacterium]